MCIRDRIKKDGVSRKLMGVKIDHNEINMSKEKVLLDEKNNIVGYIRSAAFSPNFKKIIGIAMINNLIGMANINLRSKLRIKHI